MGVYINMEMPKSCAFCRFYGAYCYAKGDEDVHSTLPCPLVPVQPHGRLIDADALMLRVDLHGTNKFGMLDDDIREFIKAAPTIIPEDHIVDATDMVNAEEGE